MLKMTPKQIKRNLDDAGYSQAAVAEQLGVTAVTVNQVIHGTTTSHRVRCFIAKAINMPVDRIWQIKADPTKVGRPLTRKSAA